MTYTSLKNNKSFYMTGCYVCFKYMDNENIYYSSILTSLYTPTDTTSKIYFLSNWL